MIAKKSPIKGPVTSTKDDRESDVISLCVLTVSNLVDRFLFWAGQLSISIERVSFKEKSDFITGG